MEQSANREKRAKIAAQTLEIVNAGWYTNGLGNRVDMKEQLGFAVNNTILYRPEKLKRINEEIGQLMDSKASQKALVEITGETTLQAARRLVLEEKRSNTVCLNFASAKNPGGGFLSGSQAQEESLARSSGLYPCIVQMNEMYDYNRSLKSCLYSDYMIYSPQVPVFREDNNKLMNEFYKVSFITAPAVNAGVVRQRDPDDCEKIEVVMLKKIEYILSVAATNRQSTIVLGAYGCGVFKNKPEDVAQYFRKILFEQGYNTLFDKIVFAIYERSQQKTNFNVFKDALHV